MTKFQKEVSELINSGFAVSEISKKLNRPMNSVSSVIKALNLKVKKNLNENKINYSYFDNIDSDDKAYFLGFIIADGSISSSKRSNGRFSINIQEEDSYILESLKSYIESPNKIYIKPSKSNSNGVKFRKPQALFRWTSKPMKEVLETKYNIKSNKTYNFDFRFPFELIPEQFYGSLIRGFIDGDGNFESHKGTFNPSIIGTSKIWLTQIGDIINLNTGLVYKIYSKKGKTCTYYTLRWSAENKDKPNKIKKLYDFLYNDAIIFMKRKHEKIESYLEYRANQIRVKGIWKCNA